MPQFTADEPITSMDLVLHTADVYDAGTDSDIFLELFDPQPGMPDCQIEIDSDADDFERNDTRTYTIPNSYYQGRIINDVLRVRLLKGDDWGSDWAFSWLNLRVNGKTLFTNFDPADPNKAIWLTDGQKWAGAYNRVAFEAPVIENIGLPDADSNMPYEIRFKAHAGRKPLKWSVTGSGPAFQALPVFTQVNADGTEATFKAHTKTTATVANWAGEIKVTDADNRITKLPVSMRVIFALPAPKVANFTPLFGWASLSPAAPGATKVTINGTDFDSRKLTSTKVTFWAADGGARKSGKVLAATSSKLEVEIPAGAGKSTLTITTDFGTTASAEQFTAHPNGYRFIDGFSFTNKKSVFPDTFDWDRYEETFGVRDMWLCEPITQVPIAPNPVATAFYLCTKGVISNGCCHGFSLTSLQIKQGLLPSTAFAGQGSTYPLQDTLWDLSDFTAPSEGLSNIIQSRQLAVFSDEALSYFLDKIDDIPNVNGNLCNMDARPALDHVNSAIANQFNDPLFLAFCKNCSPADGHVVVPYNVENGGAFQHIRCYDPNHPAIKDDPSDKNSYFSVNPNNGAWSYKGKSEVWDGFYMFTIPLSEYGHQWDWSLPGIGTLEGTLGLLAGLCSAEGGDIVQVKDASGRKLFADNGSWNLQRSTWPDGARPVPMFEPGLSKPKLVAITKPVALEFTLKPRLKTLPGLPPEPAMFSLIRGGDFSISVEEAMTPMQIHFDPADNSVRVAPVQGVGSAIVRFSHRLASGREGLTHAVRLRGIEAGKPVHATPSADRMAVALSADHDSALLADVEVTHTDRYGESHTLEVDGIAIPALNAATLRIGKLSDLASSKAASLLLELKPTTGIPPAPRKLAANIDGPAVVAPQRVINTRPHLGDPNGTSRVDIDISQSTNRASIVTYRSLYGPAIEAEENGKLRLSAAPGTRPVHLVAEDANGKRSFPRTVFVTVPYRSPIVPSLKVHGEHTIIPPGATGEIPLGVFLPDFGTHRIVLNLSVRDRLSGVGIDFPQLLEKGLTLSPNLQALNATVKEKVLLGGMAMEIEIAWDPAKKQLGRFDLGKLKVAIPAQATPGSTFLLSGKATAFSNTVSGELQKPMQIVSPLIRIWGGPEPTAVRISGPSEIVEDQEVNLLAIADGLPVQTAKAGWWITPLTGRASVRQSSPGSLQAKLTGRRAGLVKVSVVVGTNVTETLIRIKPHVKASPRRRPGIGPIAQA